MDDDLDMPESQEECDQIMYDAYIADMEDREREPDDDCDDEEGI